MYEAGGFIPQSVNLVKEWLLVSEPDVILVGDPVQESPLKRVDI